MPRTIKADGRTIVVPDDATDDEINQIVGPAPAPTPAVDTSNVAGAGSYGVPKITPPPVNMQPSSLGSTVGNLETIPTAQREPGFVGGVKTAAHNFGARVANNGIELAKPWAHPFQSILSHPGYADPGQMPGAIDTIRNSPDKLVGAENAAGDVATAALFGKAVEGTGSAMRTGARLFGDTAQTGAAALLNTKTPPTMKEVARDNNPGRGMLEAGIGPTLTKGNLSAKVNAATEAIGSRIGESVARADQNASAPPIYSSDLRAPMTGPIDEAVGRIEGPFGTTSTEPFELMRSKLGRTAPGAQTPIYGPDAPSEIAPSDLWKTIRNLDQNTRFNVDPEVESVNEVRRDIRAGLRPHLEAADPSIRPLSRTYSDLRAADTAIDRSQAPSQLPKGFGAFVDSTIKSTPVVTTAASGLFKMGGALNRFAARGGIGVGQPGVPFSQKAPTITQPPKFLTADTIGNPGGADYSAGGFPSRPPVVTPPAAQRLALPSNSSPGAVEPMVGVKATPYPSLAEDYARIRISPNRFPSVDTIPDRGVITDPNGQAIRPQLFLEAPPEIAPSPFKAKGRGSAKR